MEGCRRGARVLEGGRHRIGILPYGTDFLGLTASGLATTATTVYAYTAFSIIAFVTVVSTTATVFSFFVYSISAYVLHSGQYFFAEKGTPIRMPPLRTRWLGGD